MEDVLPGLGIEMEVATTDDDGPGRRLHYDSAYMPTPGESGASSAGVVRRFFPKRVEFYKFSPALAIWLFRHIRDYEVIHIHALFSFSSVAAAWAARWRGVPYIVRPLGTLTRYGVTRRRPLLKRLSMSLIEAPILSSAAAVHFTAEEEQREAEQLGIRFQSVVIPLGVDAFQPGGVPETKGSHGPGDANDFNVLFLSRLDPKKNLEGLIRAIGILDDQGVAVNLLIAGQGEESYVDTLRDLTADVGIKARVKWLGHVEGADKSNAFSAAAVFALPSFSENFGIAAAEALSAGLPCVLGEGVAIARQVVDYKAGLAVKTTPESIAEAILYYQRSPEAVKKASLAATSLAEAEFSVMAMGRRLKQLYDAVCE
jgi:glycosyltransferase involved in cell wall biosynthesis